MLLESTNGVSGPEPFHPSFIGTEIERLFRVALDLGEIDFPGSEVDELIAVATPAAIEDLQSLRRRDPAVRFKPIELHLSVHSTFFAVMSYRLARAILAKRPESADHLLEAMRLSYAARTQTGVDIHPEASIGPRLVIDHGWGTVIGQTVAIGRDAYILNNVVLGGRFVGDAPNGKRHPTIGDRVQISAGVRAFGPISIGDDCFIGPDVTITTDVPSRRRILLRSQSAVSPIIDDTELAEVVR